MHQGVDQPKGGALYLNNTSFPAKVYTNCATSTAAAVLEQKVI
jgi:hypothetical protein